jgi:dTDP-4-dehydrorhamnose 3,5-epimerase
LEVKKILIDGPLVIQPRIFYDARGYFYESYNNETYVKAGIDVTFVQDNQSLSQKGAVRGLHFQSPPFEQGKLVRVIKGAVYDVIVDIRKESKTFGQHYGIELNEENFTMFWIPPGFAHGFSTLRDDTVFAYKCTNLYDKSSEGGVLWNDSTLGIDWNVENPIVSDKDQILPPFKDFKSPF